MYETYMTELIVKKEIPAAVFMVKHQDVCRKLTSAGCFMNNKGKEIAVTANTIFDLASLTKVMCTLPATLVLHERKELHIDDAVTKYIPQFRYQQISIRHLLQHTSGFSADLSYVNRQESRDVFAEILQCKTVHPPNEQVIYSDLGMILLGKIIENVSGMRLDQFATTVLYQPWGMLETGFLPQVEDVNRIAATEKINGSFVHGEVHDEKAYHLGGISGSAGLFSTVKDVAKYADYWLYPEKQSLLKHETMSFVHEHVRQNRGLGFEVLQDRNLELACGPCWSMGSYGHTGFTGTSMWIDPQEELIATLLTNMVHDGRGHRLSAIRKKFHTAIYEALVE